MTSFPLRGMLVGSACALGFFHLPGTLRPAHAQQAEEHHGPTAEQRAEIQRAVHEAIQQDIRKVAQYKLPKDFFARMLPLIRQIRRANITPPTQTTNMTLATTIRRTQAMPQLQEILQEHGMSAEDFVMSLTTFEMTNAMIQAPPQKTKDTPKLDKDNVRLIQSHQALAQALVHDMDSESEHMQ